MKKLTALFLALALCLSLCTVTAFADGIRIADVLNTVPGGFPTTGFLSPAPANAWTDGKGHTAYIQHMKAYILHFDSGEIFTSEIVTKDDNGNYVCTNDTSTFTFNMKDGVLVSIDYRNSNNNTCDGTYTAPVATYTVTIDDTIQNGKVTATPTDVASGTDVTLTTAPNAGYKTKSVSVTTDGGTSVNVTGSGNNYSFVMPNENVNVTAQFIPTEIPATELIPANINYETLAKGAAITAGITVVTVGTIHTVKAIKNYKAEKAAAAEAAKLAEMPMVAFGDSGEAVTTLQTELNAQGYNCGEVDGVFGQNTLNAVKAFQTAKGLTADGVVGAQTWGALL